MSIINKVTTVMCLVALLAISTAFSSCHGAGRDIGTTTSGPGPAVETEAAPAATLCVAAKGCAPPLTPSEHTLCKTYCVTRGYDADKSYCTEYGGGACCCVNAA